jgi:hypothetical protein
VIDDKSIAPLPNTSNSTKLDGWINLIGSHQFWTTVCAWVLLESSCPQRNLYTFSFGEEQTEIDFQILVLSQHFCASCCTFQFKLNSSLQSLFWRQQWQFEQGSCGPCVDNSLMKSTLGLQLEVSFKNRAFEFREFCFLPHLQG